ncbi:hypothetical protein BLNAU_1805 [Blattamonas nauphoetae]|uniref:Uncharacterized protein n=1 Tax=Blattamonas nauphoetae TaxID=2049346 RepID=A0ABQ9YHP1_9EUKA|nr:hypothetical protein BLNAU_1805 [Blattamonas nauphoetae]
MAQEIQEMISKGRSLEDIFEHPSLLEVYPSGCTPVQNYLLSPSNITRLIQYLTIPSLDHHQLLTSFKYPFIAAEILSFDIPQVRQGLLRPNVLSPIFIYLKEQPIIPPTIGGYIHHIFNNILSDCRSNFVTIVLEQNLVQLLLRHLYLFPCCELLYGVLVFIEKEQGRDSLTQFIIEQDLIKSLLIILQTTDHPLIPGNIHQLFNSILGRYLGASPDIIFKIFFEKDKEIVKFLIDLVWNTHPVANLFWNESVQDKAIPLPSLIEHLVLDNLTFLMSLLDLDFDPQPTDLLDIAAQTFHSVSSKRKRFGCLKLHIVSLFTTLVRCPYSPPIDSILVQHSFYPLLVPLFFEYPSNSLLQNHLYTLFESTLQSHTSVARRALWHDGNLLTTTLIFLRECIRLEDHLKKKLPSNEYQIDLTVQHCSKLSKPSSRRRHHKRTSVDKHKSNRTQKQQQPDTLTQIEESDWVFGNESQSSPLSQTPPSHIDSSSPFSHSSNDDELSSWNQVNEDVMIKVECDRTISISLEAIQLIPRAYFVHFGWMMEMLQDEDEELKLAIHDLDGWETYVSDLIIREVSDNQHSMDQLQQIRESQTRYLTDPNDDDSIDEYDSGDNEPNFDSQNYKEKPDFLTALSIGPISLNET